MLIELTTPLPCTHFRPASMTSHFEESSIDGTREMSGSDATRFMNVVMAAFESSIASSMFTSMICAPLSTCCRPTASASPNWPFRIIRAKAFEPVTFVRSPTFTNSESGPMLSGSRPASRSFFSITGIGRGVMPCTAFAIARMCAGVVPQHPPAMLMKPDSANSRRMSAVYSGDSSYSPKALGRPAFGWMLMCVSATRESSSM